MRIKVCKDMSKFLSSFSIDKNNFSSLFKHCSIGCVLISDTIIGDYINITGTMAHENWKIAITFLDDDVSYQNFYLINLDEASFKKLVIKIMKLKAFL